MVVGWKELYTKRARPGADALRAYWPDAVYALYLAFADALAHELGMTYVRPVHTQSHGWGYQYGRSSMILVQAVYVKADGFTVDGHAVTCAGELAFVLAYVRALYADGFEARFAVFSDARRAKARERTEKRRTREQIQLDALSVQVDPAQFNRYRWAPKLAGEKLRRLYEADARGIPDEELCDEVGYTFYARCEQGRDTWAHISAGRLCCHACGSLLVYSPGLMVCGCGQQYLFRDYMRAFRRENMPAGAASALFMEFTDKWPGARDYAQKMRLIDWLVHAFHTNLLTGVHGRFVAVNLMEGTKPRIAALILGLAVGGTGQTADARTFADRLKE